MIYLFNSGAISRRTRAEPRTLENLVTHRSQKFGLSRDCPYVRSILWKVTLLFFDIGHPCYNWLTAVKTRYLLTSITWPYHGLKCTAHRGHMCFWSWPLTKCWFSIGLRAHVRLTCYKKGRIVRKPVNDNPGLKVNQIITFFPIQMLWLLKTECQTIYRKPHCNVIKLNSKVCLFLG